MSSQDLIATVLKLDPSQVLSEHIRLHVLRVDVDQHDLLAPNYFSYLMEPYVNMLGSLGAFHLRRHLDRPLVVFMDHDWFLGQIRSYTGRYSRSRFTILAKATYSLSVVD